MINLEDMIGECMKEEPAAQSINSILSIMDQLMAKAANPATVNEIAAEAIGIGQIRSRAELILSFLEARKPHALKVISNV